MDDTRDTVMASLLSRRSVMQLREPAPDGAMLERIVEAATRAPDHAALKPWRFLLIRGEARVALADLAVAALRRRRSDLTPEALQSQRDWIEQTPLIVALGMRLRAHPAVPEIEQVLSVGAAAMNALNAIHASGFAAIWVTGPDAHDPEIASGLGFEAPDRLAGFLMVGTAVEPPRPRRRIAFAAVAQDWPGPAIEKAIDKAIGPASGAVRAHQE